MGHLGHLKQEYRALVRRLDANQVAYAEPEDPTAWQGWKEILEILYTPEEAALAARLPVRPSSLAQLESRLGIPRAELQTRLEPMCEKGVVMDLVHPRTGEVRYLLSPPIVGFIERMIGTIRRDLLDHVIVLGEGHLRRQLHRYLRYYHGARTHLALAKDAPEPRSMELPELGRVVALPQVGGLHHRYYRRAA